MTAIQTRNETIKAKMRQRIRGLSDKMLIEVWNTSTTQIGNAHKQRDLDTSEAIALTRGLLIEELDHRFGEDRVEAWLDAGRPTLTMEMLTGAK